MRLKLVISYLAAVPMLVGQPGYRPYHVIGLRPGPEQAATTERLRTILVEGWNVTPADAAQMEGVLDGNPENLPVRIRLISYYAQQLLNEQRVRHVLWLIEAHPDSDAFHPGDTTTRISPTDTGRNRAADYARVRDLWQQQARRFAGNTKVLSNAAIALSGGDPDIALDMVQSARRADPGNLEWTAWLARIYAAAIRWSFWDGKSTMTFISDADESRHPAFGLSSSMSDNIAKKLESSMDGELVAAVGDALLRQVRSLRDRNSLHEPFSPLTPELPRVEEFGEKLVRRARTLGAR